MARKRSLKDAAADQLVEKNKTVPKTPVAPAERPAAAPSAVREIQVAPSEESSGGQFFAAQPSPVSEGMKPAHPALMWIAIALLIGCVGGYFFGLGQAGGPADIFFLIFGLAAGYFFGRF
jgi:hypothetical protein